MKRKDPVGQREIMAPITITLSFDSGYAEQATLMLYSLLSNNRQDCFRFFVFYNDLSAKVQGRIEANLSIFSNFSIEWKKFDSSFTDGLYIRKGHANKYTYTRLLMSDVLKDVDRFLYLDSDILVLGNIRELWETPLNGKTLAAVEDPFPFDRYQFLNMPAGKKYFNAGVLLFNSAQWRKNGYTQVVLDKLVELGIHATCWDQDGLNAALYDDWEPLPARWNIQSHDVEEAQRSGMRNIRKKLSPKIIHFTGNLKPWNYKSNNPFKKDYYRYLRQTDFSQSHKPENKTAVNIMRRAVRNTLVQLRILKH